MATRSIGLDLILDSLAAPGAATIDPRRLSETLHMTLGEIAGLAGVHRTTLTRNPASPEIQARLGPIATILARAADMSGGVARAVLWFRHQPIPALGQKRASDMVKAGHADAVLAWLDALEDGAYA